MESNDTCLLFSSSFYEPEKNNTRGKFASTSLQNCEKKSIKILSIIIRHAVTSHIGLQRKNDEK